MNRLRTTFYRFGWLMPAALPLAQAGGRALFNVLAIAYFFWGLVALAGSHVRIQRSIVVVYTLLVLTLVLSTLDAVDQERGLRKVAEYVAHSMAFFFTLMVLQSDDRRMSEMVTAFALSACALLAVLSVQYLWLQSLEGFDPKAQLREDNLPFLMPVLVYYLSIRIRSTGIRMTANASALLLAAAYIIAAGGRAAFLGLMAALLLYLLLVLRRKWYEACIAILLVAAVAILIGEDRFARSIEAVGDNGTISWIEKLDEFGGGRVSLWRHALANPPKNTLLGVGMGNAQYAEAAMETRYGKRVRHLHNFVLDAWYETGIAGVLFLLALLVMLFRASYQGLRRLARPDKALAGMVLSSATAIVVAALLSFSYGSRQFSLYLFVLLAMGYALYQRTEKIQ